MNEPSNHNKSGLSDENINLITTVIFLALLIFGPIGPPGQLVRLLYLVGAPTVVWLGLKGIGKHWQAGKVENDRLVRFIAAVIAVGFFVGAFIAFTEKSHTGCDQYARTSDGQECVGDYVPASGPDLFQGLFLGGLGCAAIWYSVFRRDDD
jgi:hypothetical protein